MKCLICATAARPPQPKPPFLGSTLAFLPPGHSFPAHPHSRPPAPAGMVLCAASRVGACGRPGLLPLLPAHRAAAGVLRRPGGGGGAGVRLPMAGYELATGTAVLGASGAGCSWQMGGPGRAPAGQGLRTSPRPSRPLCARPALAVVQPLTPAGPRARRRSGACLPAPACLQADEVCRRCMVCLMRGLLGQDDAAILEEAQVCGPAACTLHVHGDHRGVQRCHTGPASPAAARRLPCQQLCGAPGAAAGQGGSLAPPAASPGLLRSCLPGAAHAACALQPR